MTQEIVAIGKSEEKFAVDDVIGTGWQITWSRFWPLICILGVNGLVAALIPLASFVMGYNGAAGTYTYEWYLGSVEPENKIADLNTNDGATNVTFSVPQVNGEHGNVVDVILVVKDIESPNAESTGSASVTAQLTVNPVVFMPLVNKP